LKTACRQSVHIALACLLGGPVALANSPAVVIGLDGAAQDNVTAFLGYAEESCATPAWRLRALYAQAPAKIREALEVFGYYDPIIERSLEQTEDCLTATYNIDPGPQVLYRNITVAITGADNATPLWQTVLNANPLRAGEPLNHEAYRSYRQRLEDTARRYGYFAGEFEQRRIDVYPEEMSADVTLIFAPGPRYRFGEVALEQDVVTPELLTRFIEFDSGEPYDANQIAKLYEALLLTGYFSSVDIRMLPAELPKETVDVIITAAAAKPTTWTAGLGFGTDTGPKVRLGYFNRRRNVKGHQWSATTSLSPVIAEAGLSYRIPLDRPRAEWLYFDAGYKDEDTDTSSSQLAKVGVKQLEQRGKDWLETRFIDVSNEDFVLADNAGSVFLVIPGVSWNRVDIDNIARPRKGFRFTFQITGTTELIGSDINALQSIASGKLIVPLPWQSRLLTRLEVGTTLLDDFDELPASLRFFAGGDFSVRGYDYETLGPLAGDGSGAVVGGESILTGSVEFDKLIGRDWTVAAFADAGNAFNSFSDINLQFSAGGGVRWFSPVGPVRFDLAFPMGSDLTDDSFRIHITLSPDL
jgi:translocation and assembly module TamA